MLCERVVLKSLSDADKANKSDHWRHQFYPKVTYVEFANSVWCPFKVVDIKELCLLTVQVLEDNNDHLTTTV